jgi:hypothetical protein
MFPTPVKPHLIFGIGKHVIISFTQILSMRWKTKMILLLAIFLLWIILAMPLDQLVTLNSKIKSKKSQILSKKLFKKWIKITFC